MVLLVGLGFVLLGPGQLGGPAVYVVVDGTSMEPTYADGDLVIGRASDTYRVGDIVVFLAPDGFAGEFPVIHRIVDRTAEGWVMQGDNRDTVDPWAVDDDDILGSAVLRIPTIGGMFRTGLQRAAILGLGAGLLVLTIGGGKRSTNAERAEAEPSREP